MTDNLSQPSFWLQETITPWDIYSHGITRVLAHQKTPFQELHIVETGAYGKALVLDHKWQSCTGDEFLYHEALVHPAMVLHASPQQVLVLGGAEGATLREVLRWKTVERVVMVDIDGDVVAACQQHLPEMHQQAFSDPRVELVIDDALTFLDQTAETWDVVISDLSDPIESGPAYKLFTQEHYQQVKRVIDPGGFYMLQAGPTAPAELQQHTRVIKTLTTVFKQVQTCLCHAVTFGSPLAFALASDRTFPHRPDPATIDARLAEQTLGQLQLMDGETLLGMMQVPKHLRRAIAAEQTIYTLGNPPQL
ncbi:MAG: spermidine synthase [Leptolyngbya sp. SIO4C1]|nr:spermidine synthase [Leptolyngbya sp. SIO4C1]